MLHPFGVLAESFGRSTGLIRELQA
jgi:hypothetical protein